MANINDFKLLKLKNMRMYNYTFGEEIHGIDDTMKERLGFYHLILESIAGIVERYDDTFEIIDTEYNKVVHNECIDDLGIDVVYINENIGDENENENNTVDIKLFNFKYRVSYKQDKTTSEGDLSRSTKFIEYIVNGKTLDDTQNTKVYRLINRIIKLLNSNKICNITLYMVSNEANGFAENSNGFIKILEENYGMKVMNISLDDIMGFYSNRNNDHNCKFMISPSEFLSFQNDERSTQKSYIIKLSLLDLVRITCNDEALTCNYSFEDDEDIKNAILNYSLLYDNVRGFLGETKYNKNIISTLNHNYTNFFMFNNGITITAEAINCDSKNSGKKYLFEIENFQIVNGGQTIRSIYNFLSHNRDVESIEKLSSAFVLLRIFKINPQDQMKNLIAQYTNSQNAISDRDLKSIDAIQIQIEQYFEELDIMYARKSGDLGIGDKQYKYRISMDRLTQILYSYFGFPDRASNQKQRLFQDYYDDIYKTEKFTLELCKDLVEQFFEIYYLYIQERDRNKVSDQKVLYIIYIAHNTNLTLLEAIDCLEDLLTKYSSDVALSRKLIQKGFKEFLNESLGISTLNGH